MRRQLVALALGIFLSGSSTVLASDGEHGAATPAPADSAASSAVLPAVPAWTFDRTEKRPMALSALYGTYATLQVMDIVSSRKAIAAGAQEVNPLMGSGGTARMLAMKGVGAGLSIYLAEKMWKKNRLGAIVTMAAMNGLTAAVVAHNTHIARR